MRKPQESRTKQLLNILLFLKHNHTGKLVDFANINDGYSNAAHDASLLRDRGYIFLKDDRPTHHLYALCEPAIDVIDKIIEVYAPLYFKNQ